MVHATDAIWRPEHGITDFVITEFTAGACHHLALALHRVTGWPIMAELPPEEPDALDGAIHYWVVTPEGKAVDIQGVHATDWANTPYSLAHPEGPLRVVPRQTLLSDNSDPSTCAGRLAREYAAWAETLVAHFPEHFGLPEHT